MASRRGPEIRASLLRKGFLEVKSHHRKLILYYHGRKTNIRTKVSHDIRKEYSGGLLKAVQKQLRLETVTDVLALIDCPMTHELYIADLLRRNEIRDP